MAILKEVKLADVSLEPSLSTRKYQIIKNSNCFFSRFSTGTDIAALGTFKVTKPVVCFSVVRI